MVPITKTSDYCTKQDCSFICPLIPASKQPRILLKVPHLKPFSSSSCCRRDAVGGRESTLEGALVKTSPAQASLGSTGGVPRSRRMGGWRSNCSELEPPLSDRSRGRRPEGRERAAQKSDTIPRAVSGLQSFRLCRLGGGGKEDGFVLVVGEHAQLHLCKWWTHPALTNGAACTRSLAACASGAVLACPCCFHGPIVGCSPGVGDLF